MLKRITTLTAMAIALCATGLVASANAAGLPGRGDEPVVLKGSELPELTGTAPDRIVGFAFDNGWKQIPVQIDERAIVDLAAVRQGNQTDGRPFSVEAYTDPGTFAGADPDPSFDDDDELALMAGDAGENAVDDIAPLHTVGAPTVIRLEDPLHPGEQRAIALYVSDGTLDPAAGKSYVDYDFSLDSGDYKTTYSFSGVPGGDSGNPSGGPANTEDSTVTTPHYRLHLLSRWVTDGLRLPEGDIPSTDLLDGDKAQVAYGCGRSELTFSRGGGGFIANKSGPVRAIRSYIGANSGTYTQQDITYYERSEVIRTYLRVHPGINVIDQFLDFSPGAAGMTYRTSADPVGVTIDGVPDPGMETGSALGPELEWEQASGAQGSISTVSRVVTDIPTFTAGSYYQDDSTSPATMQCGGYADDQAWGASGPAISGVGVNTDPTLGPANSLTGTRTVFFDPPFADAAAATAAAERHSEQVDNPLDAEVLSAPPPPAGALRAKARFPRSAKAGRRLRIPVRVGSPFDEAIGPVRVCPKVKRSLAEPGRCKAIRRLAPNGERKLRISVVPRPRAGGRSLDVRVLVSGPGATSTATAGTVQVRGR